MNLILQMSLYQGKNNKENQTAIPTCIIRSYFFHITFIWGETGSVAESSRQIPNVHPNSLFPHASRRLFFHIFRSVFHHISLNHLKHSFCFSYRVIVVTANYQFVNSIKQEIFLNVLLFQLDLLYFNLPFYSPFLSADDN